VDCGEFLGSCKETSSYFSIIFAKAWIFYRPLVPVHQVHSLLLLLMVFFLEMKGSVWLQTSRLADAVPGEW
jgi:hypothetical protein